MIPKSQVRKKKNSSKVNLIISAVFHAILVGALFYFAAREGLLGNQLKKIAVEMVKEKPPEKPKEPPKVEPPKVEPPKIEQAKAEAPKEVPQAVPAAAPVVAPENVDVPNISFDDGAHAVQTSSDPIQLYKGQIEYALRSKWNRPGDMADDTYAALVNVAVSRDGQITDPRWQTGSGDQRWDDSVRQVFATDTTISRPPPTNFPARVDVRFDVQEETEPVMP
jgi:hypothetical protein